MEETHEACRSGSTLAYLAEVRQASYAEVDPSVALGEERNAGLGRTWGSAYPLGPRMVEASPAEKLHSHQALNQNL